MTTFKLHVLRVLWRQLFKSGGRRPITLGDYSISILKLFQCEMCDFKRNWGVSDSTIDCLYTLTTLNFSRLWRFNWYYLTSSLVQSLWILNLSHMWRKKRVIYKKTQTKMFNWRDEIRQLCARPDAKIVAQIHRTATVFVAFLVGGNASDSFCVLHVWKGNSKTSRESGHSSYMKTAARIWCYNTAPLNSVQLLFVDFDLLIIIL